jgi:hypothetical protein
MTFWETLQAMLGGPGHLRFIIQPLVALLLGLRDGRLDAEAGRPPYLLSVLRDKGHRRERLGQALRAVAKPLGVALTMDALLQYYVVGRIRPLMVLLVGSFLIALPYVLMRGLSNRLLRRRVPA